MMLPDGVTQVSNITIHKYLKTCLQKYESSKKSNKFFPKAEYFLDEEAVKSQRIFISTFIYHSTYAHFALGDKLAGRIGIWSKAEDFTRYRMKTLEYYFGKGVTDFAFSYYSATQFLLSKKDDKDHVILYRGFSRETSKLLLDDLYRPGVDAKIHLNSLSSWSDQAFLAERFAQRTGGMAIRLSIPKCMVFSYWELDTLMEHILRRQIKQHLNSDIENVGGEAIVWCPTQCIPLMQNDIITDYTQITPSGKL